MHPLKGRSKRAWILSVLFTTYVSRARCLSQSRSSINYSSHYPLFSCLLQSPPVPNQVQGNTLKALLSSWPGTPAGLVYNLRGYAIFYFVEKSSNLKTISNSICQCAAFGAAGIEAFSRGNVNWQCFQEHYGFRFVPFKQYFLSLPARDYLECKLQTWASHCVHVCMGLEHRCKRAFLGLTCG